MVGLSTFNIVINMIVMIVVSVGKLYSGIKRLVFRIRLARMSRQNVKKESELNFDSIPMHLDDVNSPPPVSEPHTPEI